MSLEVLAFNSIHLDHGFAKLYATDGGGTPWWRNRLYLDKHPGTTYWETIFLRIWLIVLIYWNIVTSFLRKRPNLLLCGIEKCGTSTLATHLCSSSHISCPSLAYVKEEAFFCVNWNNLPFAFLGFDYVYRAHGPYVLLNYKYVLDADMFNGFFPGPCASLNPVGTKFILMLRDPVDRAISAFNMLLRSNFPYIKPMSVELTWKFYSSLDTLTHNKLSSMRMKDNVSPDDIAYFSRLCLLGIFELGKYDVPLSMLLRKHPPENIFVSHIEALKHEPQALYNACCQFLRVPTKELLNSGLKRFSAGKYEGTNHEGAEYMLQIKDHYRKHYPRIKTLLKAVKTYPTTMAFSPLFS